MMKKRNKLSVVLLSLVMVFSLTVPVLALPVGDYSVLNVVYAPGGTGVNSTVEQPIEYKAYKLADTVSAEDGTCTYALTNAFKDSGIDINSIISEGQEDGGISVEAQRNLLNTFGTYINANRQTIEENAAEGDIRVVETARMAIGTSSEERDGVAQFKGLTDGLYLITCGRVYTIGNTQYTAVPFILTMPYVLDGVTNNYLTATVKFTTYTPGGGGGGGQPDPVDPDPENPAPEGPGPENNPDPGIVDIPGPDVPLVDSPELPEIDIPDPDVPLANLPQTGLLWWPVPVLAAAGLALMALGVVSRKKANRNG